MGLDDLIARQPAASHARLKELRAEHFFTEEDLEFFVTAHEAPLGEGRLPEFTKFLETKDAKPKKQTTGAPVKRKGAMASGALRTQALSILAPGLRGAGVLPPAGAIVAAEEAAASREVVTPASKKLRSDWDQDLAGGAGFASPEPVRKPQYRFTPKSSVSDGSSSEEKYEDAKGASAPPVEVRLLGDPALWTGKRQGAYSWMDESLEERTAARDRRFSIMEDHIMAALQARRGGEGVAVGQVGVPAQAEVAMCGRIVCEGLDGRLNERSMLLEGSRASANGARVQLSVADCESLAAFPGQIVGVLGRSGGMMGTTFHAKELLPGIPPAPVAATNERPVRMLVAAGPFCLRSDLDYAPLEQVLEHAASQRPQVLVLMGPFLDASNQKVLSGETCLPGTDEPCSFEEFYERRLLPLLRRGLAPLRQGPSPVEVLIMPSLDEALCFHPMPQPPLDVALEPLGLTDALQPLRRLGVKFLPNPAHLEVNGLRVSVTSADALTPVLREIVLRPQGKKIEEAHRLLLRQRSLFPAVPRDPAQVSEARSVALDFPDLLEPDVCIFPSLSGTPTGAFVDGSIFVNPGSLCRPAALGTFADLRVAPRGPAPDADGARLRGRARVDVFNVQVQS